VSGSSVADIKEIAIEFTNLAKVIAGEREIKRSFPVDATFGDIIAWLAETYPDMVGILIQENRREFTNSTMFIINNEMSFPAMIMEESPKDGERLTIVSIPTGG
jgi:hypothetical protein